MKKILFFSLESGTVGGIQRVNDTLSQELAERGISVKPLFLRLADGAEPAAGDCVLRARPWRLPQGQEILSALKKGHLPKAISLLFSRLWESLLYRVDLHRAKKLIQREAPDAVVSSHYLLLDGIPAEFLPRTLHHVHTSYTETMRIPACAETLRRYNGRISFLWLSRAICQRARAEGFHRSAYLYNPLPFFPTERTKAEESNTVVLITRFSEEKRIPLAVRLLRQGMDALSDPNAFSVEIYGFGPEEEAIRKEIGTDSRFRLMGRSESPMLPLSKARFTVNTSLFEGFSLSVLEAASAGVPTLSFFFGEAAPEEILHDKTGFLVPMEDTEAFLSHLTRLFTERETVLRLSQGAREFSLRFDAKTVTGEFLELLSSLPLDKKEKED